MLKKAVLKSFVDKGTLKIIVFGDEERLAFDQKLKDFEGKEVELEVWEKNDKKYCSLPKEGGFAGKSSGWKGKSKEEIYFPALTMTLSYAKDICQSLITQGSIASREDAVEFTEKTYKRFSQMILADLAKILSTLPKPSEPTSGTPESAKSTQQPSSSAPPTGGQLTVKEKLVSEMKAYLAKQNSDTPENFKTLLITLTEFEGKDKVTGEPTGRMVFIDDINDSRYSEKWMQRSIGTLRAMVEEDEHIAKMNAEQDDIPF